MDIHRLSNSFRKVPSTCYLIAIHMIHIRFGSHMVLLPSPLTPPKLTNKVFFCPFVPCHKAVSPFPFKPFVFGWMPVMYIVMTFTADMHHRTIFLGFLAEGLTIDVMDIKVSVSSADFTKAFHQSKGRSWSSATIAYSSTPGSVLSLYSTESLILF